MTTLLDGRDWSKAWSLDFREVDWSAGSNTFITFTNTSSSIQIRAPFTAQIGTGLLFKAFPTSFLNNSFITVDHSGTSSENGNAGEVRLRVLNAFYDRNTGISSPATFPPNAALSTESVQLIRPYDIFSPGSFARVLDTVAWQITDNNDGFSTIFLML